MKKRTKDIIVYGSFNDQYVVFLKKGDAEYYAGIYQCHKEGVTFGELHNRYPWLLNLIVHDRAMLLDILIEVEGAEELECEEYFNLIFKGVYKHISKSVPLAGKITMGKFEKGIDIFREFYENEVKVSDRFPMKNDMFNETYCDRGDLLSIMNYHPKMDWVPSDIVKEFGDIGASFFGDKILNFRISNTENIVAALMNLGFNCIRDDLLIAKAYGYD